MTDAVNDGFGIFEAPVPGCVYTHLPTTGFMENPFCRDKEIPIKELSNKNYGYNRGFQISVTSVYDIEERPTTDSRR